MGRGGSETGSLGSVSLARACRSAPFCRISARKSAGSGLGGGAGAELAGLGGFSGGGFADLSESAVEGSEESASSLDRAIRSAPFCRISARKLAGSGLEGGADAAARESGEAADGFEEGFEEGTEEAD